MSYNHKYLTNGRCVSVGHCTTSQTLQMETTAFISCSTWISVTRAFIFIALLKIHLCKDVSLRKME